jgi:3-hydroxyisobutyrate dehydrogenase
MEVGFVGLGAMGLPMTHNLLQKGHSVTVASRSRGPVKAAVDMGATDAGDPASVVAASGVTVVCVPDSPDVESVIASMIPSLGPGKTVVDCSTIDPDVERAQHDRVGAAGARYLEAPVSGGTVGAERGTLTLMVGGDAGTLDDVRPVLDAFSALIVHVGGPGMGQVVKLCNNLIYAAQMLATSEAAALATRAGADLARLHEVIVHSSGDCVAVRTRFPVDGVVPDSPASTGWQPGFMTDLMSKDVALALAYGAALGVPMPGTALARQMLVAASAAGYGREDFSAIAKIVDSLAGG